MNIPVSFLKKTLSDAILLAVLFTSLGAGLFSYNPSTVEAATKKVAISSTKSTSKTVKTTPITKATSSLTKKKAVTKVPVKKSATKVTSKKPVKTVTAVAVGTALGAALPTKVTVSTTTSVSTTSTVTSEGVSSAGGRPFEISGWIPYWRTAAGVADVLPHISTFTEVNPFGYTVKNDGSLYNALKIEGPEWQNLKSAAASSNTRFVPTVMWSDTAVIHKVLSDPDLRHAHELSIMNAIQQNGFDGIDIDYEGKSSDDQANFSAFLMELSGMLNQNGQNKFLSCTIESRQPLEARYSGTPPADIAYANDFKVINKYCNRVKVMTYDQQNADIQLNRAHQGELYYPLSDPAWVEKVVNYMAQDIDKSKMIIGIPTYGYIAQAMPSTDGTSYSYTLLEAFNPRYGTETAAQYGITPTRNAAGELGFSYVPKETTSLLPSQSILAGYAPAGTTSSLLASLGALTLAKTTQKQSPVQVLSWSDSVAIKAKVDLAHRLGVRGVAVFKFDGGEDQGIWNVLK
jgi:spore germination protein